MKRNSVKITVIALAASIIVSSGLVGFSQYATTEKTASTSSQYITETARKSDIDVTVSATGTVYASVTKDIVANNSGEIKDLSVKEGDTVKAGDKLFTVDNQQIRQQVSVAQLNLEKQQLQMDKMKTQDDINLQNLQIQDAQNSLNNAEAQLNNMTVTSPINGVVITRNNNDGDNIQSGKAVITVIDPQSLKVKAAVDELDISKVKVGQTVQVKFNAIDGKTYDGTVDSISALGSTTNNVTTYNVDINLNDKTGVMLGMTANVSIQVESKSDVLAIPAEALIQRGSRSFVMVPASTDSASKEQSTDNKANSNNSNNSSTQNGNWSSNRNSGYGNGMRNGFQTVSGTQGKLVEVQTGIQNQNLIEIISGITEGQKVMVQLPQSSAGSNNTRNTNRGMSGFGSGLGGGMLGNGSNRSSSNR